jgi:hypothetical protein
MVAFTSALLLASALLAAPPPQDCATTDLMPAFWSFWEKARGLPPEEQFRLFDATVIQPNAAVYAGIFEEVPKPPAEFVPASFDRVPAIESSMRALSARLTADLPAELAAFRRTFPKFRCAVPVYFLYSAGAFDGATRDVAGKESLMFGLDVIARLEEELSPLVAHELFHVYHGEAVDEESKAFSWSMWEEGLASYVSRRLNPALPEEKICCLPQIDRADLPKIAAAALGLLDSESREDYARYFLGGQKESEVPARSGYYLGYLVASEAGKTHTLEELAAWSPRQVRAAAEKTLRQLAGDEASKTSR